MNSDAYDFTGKSTIHAGTLTQSLFGFQSFHHFSYILRYQPLARTRRTSKREKSWNLDMLVSKERSQDPWSRSTLVSRSQTNKIRSLFLFVLIDDLLITLCMGMYMKNEPLFSGKPYG